MKAPGDKLRTRVRTLAVVAVAAAALCLCACGVSGTTSGDPFTATYYETVYDEGAAQGGYSASIDTSHASEGYIYVSATNDSRLKLQVTGNDGQYNYDIPGDGTPTAIPLNMGDGYYRFAVMQNTSGNRYVEIYGTSKTVEMADEFQPFLHASVFCNFSQDSACVQRAQSLVASAENEGDAVALIYEWITDNIDYDNDKAAQLSDSSGYVPDPDETLSSGKGICFDYASLAAAMLRSVGIPCKIITGYVSPNGLYHAWNMVYINGTWQTEEITINANEWCRIDTTFAATGPSSTIGDGTEYTDRFTY